MKKYRKTHTDKEALKSHLEKIKERKGITEVKGLTIYYYFPDTSVEANSLVDLIKEAAQKGYRKVKVKFKPAYDPELHKIVSAKLKKSLKKSKTEIFDVVKEGSEIIDLKKSKDVDTMEFI